MKRILMICSISLLAAGCSQTEPAANTVEPEAAKKAVVATSFYPLTHFAKQVGGDKVTVQQVAAQGSDPHTFEPTPHQLKNIYSADILLVNGTGLEPWAERVQEEVESKGIAVMVASELVDRLPYGRDEHEDYSEDEHHDDDAHDEHEDEHDDHEDHEEHEGDEHHHDHGEWDPHVWLDPSLAEDIVKAIAEKLSAIDPANAMRYKANADAYVSKLRTLDSDMIHGLSACQRDAVIVSHDAFRYIAHRYGFHALEISGLAPSAEPNPARMAELAEIAEEEGISYVFFETHVSPALSQTLADEIGAETLVLHPISALTKQERSSGKTYIDLMRQNLQNLRIALECS